jgi:hypothetical protein
MQAQFVETKPEHATCPARHVRHERVQRRSDRDVLYMIASHAKRRTTLYIYPSLILDLD